MFYVVLLDIVKNAHADVLKHNFPMRIKTTTTVPIKQPNISKLIGLGDFLQHKTNKQNQRYSERACVCKPVGLDVIGDTFVVYNNTSASLNQV